MKKHNQYIAIVLYLAGCTPVALEPRGGQPKNPPVNHDMNIATDLISSDETMDIPIDFRGVEDMPTDMLEPVRDMTLKDMDEQCSSTTPASSIDIANKIAVGLGYKGELHMIIRDAQQNETCAQTLLSSDNTQVLSAQGSRIEAHQLGQAQLSIKAGNVTKVIQVDVRSFVGSLGAGYQHGCALSKDGQAFCWGSNDNKQSGSSHLQTPIATPTSIETSLRFKPNSLAVGQKHNCAIAEDNKTYCWGRNESGALGNGRTGQDASPQQVQTNETFVQVQAGHSFSCGLNAAGKMFCWGSNHKGQLGDGGTTNHSTPVAVNTNVLFRSMDLGDNFACAISLTDELYCWGANDNGKLGLGIDNGQEYTPKKVTLPNAVLAIGTGEHHACAILSDGRGFCWGDDTQGKGALGNGQEGARSTPTPIDSNSRYKSIASGFRHTCAITQQNQVHCWGGGTLGLRGDGNNIWRIQHPVPTVDIGTPMKHLTLTRKHTCVINLYGVGYCWGEQGVHKKLGVVQDNITFCESSDCINYPEVLQNLR